MLNEFRLSKYRNARNFVDSVSKKHMFVFKRQFLSNDVLARVKLMLPDNRPVAVVLLMERSDSWSQK